MNTLSTLIADRYASLRRFCQSAIDDRLESIRDLQANRIAAFVEGRNDIRATINMTPLAALRAEVAELRQFMTAIDEHEREAPAREAAVNAAREAAELAAAEAAEADRKRAIAAALTADPGLAASWRLALAAIERAKR